MVAGQPDKEHDIINSQHTDRSQASSGKGSEAAYTLLGASVIQAKVLRRNTSSQSVSKLV